MPENEETIVTNLANHYTVKVMRAFNNVDPVSGTIQLVAKTLKDVFRYFEPSFFEGNIFVCKTFDDSCCFDRTKGVPLYDKNILLNKTGGLLIVQVFSDNSLMFWENENTDDLINQNNNLVYHYFNNRECFYANQTKIDITLYDKGSRFATQFKELVDALQQYAVSKVFNTSCSHFSDSWSDTNRLFFKGGGRGNNIPEKFMQLSLNEFLNTILVRGVSMESSREYNTLGDFSKPKPVDVKIHWREANRTAIIEIKFIGTVKKEADGEIYTHDNARANKGITQLKGYYDSVKTDLPTTIIKSYLVVIDGRRNNLNSTNTTISQVDGMYYKDIEIAIDDDKKFHESIPGFERLIRMFAAPKCI